MRGSDGKQEPIFSYVGLAERIPNYHPLRALRSMVDQALRELDLHFAALYARRGRPFIPPEQLVRALLLMILYSIRSERSLMEHIRYNLAYRWFVGLGMDDEVWQATVFSKNRERLMQGAVTERLFEAVLAQARGQGLLSEEHFTVAGTPIRTWAHRDSFHPKDHPPNQGTGRRGNVLLRDSHESSTDAEARLYKKSLAAPSFPSYLGHAVIENRNGMVVATCATQSSTTAEREACLTMLETMADGRPAITLGAGKQYQDPTFIRQLRQRGVIPHVAEYEPGPHACKKSLLLEEREGEGFRISQQKRKLVEKVCGWCKLDRVLRQVTLRGLRKVDWLLRLAMTAHNLRRLVTLIYAQ